jgi:ABC-type glycerol-3-phosphate transport system permease component
MKTMTMNLLRGDRWMKSRLVVRNVFIYLFLVLISIVTIFPLLWGVASSLRSDDELYRYAIPFSSKTLIPQDVTFEAYIRLFNEFNFFRPIINTLVITTLTIFFSCIVNSIAAFSFAIFNFKLKNVIYAVILVSFMIPFEAIALPLYNVVNQFRWVDTYQGILIPSIADGLVLFLFTQFFRDIPMSLIEAARVDGAGWLRIFFKIIMPSSVPVFVTAGLMTFMGQWNSYFWPLLIARSRHIQMVQIALGSLRSEHSILWSCLYGGSIISALIPLFLFLPFQRYYVQGVLGSGIKG